MSVRKNILCSVYPRELISSYHECELEPADELRVEEHLAGCGICLTYLNSLKAVSTSLEILLEKDPLPPIPEKFTKTVRAAAESSVNEVRSKKERSRGLLVAAILFCCAAVVFVFDSGSTAPAFNGFSGKLFALGGFVAHTFYDLAVGFSVIIRGICSKFFFGSVAAAAGVILILIMSVLIFSKHMTRLNRS